MTFTTLAGADAALTYELIGTDGIKTVKKFSTARFFVRVDDPEDEKHYLLYQAGKFFPLFSVDQANATYTRLTPTVTPYMGPETTAKKVADETPSEVKAVERSPAPNLNPTNKMRTVAGIRCRVVQELLDGKPVIEHCMANSAELGITTREVTSLSRLFVMSRDREYGWLGTSTEDEEFVSVQSRDLRDKRELQLIAVSTEPLPAGYLRISKEYQEVKPKAQIN
jgi:hypothetical protein